MKHKPTIDRAQSESVSTRQPPPADTEKVVPERFSVPPAHFDGIDNDLVDKTKTQIRNLVSEIATLARSECAQQDFFEGFLIKTTTALASDGGAIWLRDSDSSPLELQYHINLDQTCLADDETAQVRHSLLLNKIVAAGEPALIPAHSGSADQEEAGNPTDRLLIFAPLIVNRKLVGLIEIFQRSGAGPTTQRGYQRFLSQMGELANEYLKNQQLKNFAQQQLLWQQLDSFVTAIHAGLDPEQTSYIIANEGRRIIDCDRVSVLHVQGRRCRISAVSGLDSIERRADQIKQLQQLTRAVVRAGDPLWYHGDGKDLPPQIEKTLHAYVDKSHARTLAILPLRAESDHTQRNASATATPKIIGALVVEQLKDATADEPLRRRAEVVARHSQSALSNAIEHNSLFLLPLWKTLGKAWHPLSGSRLPKTLFLLTLLIATIAFFALFPYPFSLSSNGQLRPRIQHEVFARVDGVLQEVLVSPNDPDVTQTESQIVQEGDILAKMTNNNLMVQIQNLQGQVNQTKEQIRKFQYGRTEKLGKFENIMLDGELLKSQEQLKSLQRELKIKRDQAAHLQVRSPGRGFVVNWQVRRNLLKRPVNRGQNLMTVIDPDGGWELELEIPERRVGHLMKRLRDSEEPLRVQFALISHPGHEFTGTLTHIDQTMDVYSEEGNCAKATVTFDNQQLPPDLLKAGTRINAQLHCGTRSIGFVWFHELFETVEMTYKYWF